MQQTLFDRDPEPVNQYGLPMSRATDPVTSKVAAVKHATKADAHRAIILDELRRNDGQTGHELGVATGLGQVECCRRLSELLRDELVTRCESDRPCKIKPQSKQLRYWYLGE